MSPKRTRPNEDDNIASTARLARAVVYLRVSTKDQAERGGEGEGFSIPAQREACKRKAAALGAVIVDEFVDRGESAKTADRPELQRMLHSIAAEPVQYVIVHKVDRLARNRVDDVQINVALRATGASLVSCTENIDETPSGALMHGIMSSIAEFYSRNLANEVIKGSTQKAIAGGTNGKAPTGYLNVRKVTNGIEARGIDIDPERGPLMKWAFEEYATGRWTIRNLLNELTARGLCSTPSREKPSKPLVVSNLHRLLRSPYYKGVVRYRGVEYPGSHSPLITEETWNQVQAVLDAQNYSGEKHRDHPHYLKGSVFCGQCGSRLVISKNRGRRGKVYEYFVCIGRGQKRTSCTQRAVLIEQVEILVEDHYLYVQPMPELLAHMRSTIAADLGRHREHAKMERGIQERRLRQCESERAKLLEAYYAGAIPVDLMRVEQQRLATDMASAARRLESLIAESDAVEINLDRAIDLAGNWHEVYMKAGDRDRRQLNQAIFQKLYITAEGDVTHEFAEPFDLMLGEQVVKAVVERVDRMLSSEQSAAIDREWKRLSSSWAVEATNQRSRDANRRNVDESPIHERTPAAMVAVGGSYMDLMVGAEGLEPPTIAL